MTEQGETAKKRVLAVWPAAHDWLGFMSGTWRVNQSTKDGNPEIGYGETREAAWLHAASRLPAPPESTNHIKAAIIHDPFGGRNPDDDTTTYGVPINHITEATPSKVGDDTCGVCGALVRAGELSKSCGSDVRVEAAPVDAGKPYEEAEKGSGWAVLYDICGELPPPDETVWKAGAEITRLRASLESMQGERDMLRTALIQTGRNVGAFLTDEVSTDFIMGVPDEARLVVERLTAERDRLKERVAELEIEPSERFLYVETRDSGPIWERHWSMRVNDEALALERLDYVMQDGWKEGRVVERGLIRTLSIRTSSESGGPK